MRGPRIVVVAALAFAALALPAIADGADARKAELPPALSKVSAIRAIYPDLHRNELARKDGFRWERLRRSARTRWMRTHPCVDATLNRRYRLGASSWSIVEATWECDGVAHGTRRFLRCITDKEGGKDVPDRWFGSSTGWQGGRFAGTDRVVNHFQTRPYHARKVAPEVAGRDLRVTRETFEILTHPVNAARIAVRVGRRAYATAGLCS